ncbi:MAG: DUF4938 domain-containing protein [Chloroflexaceae bacterium]|nr:DUF4938 domain-containing protein [Chloroflexaceae bacterium]
MSAEPVQMVLLRRYDGPHIFGPHAGVWLRIGSGDNCQQALTFVLKDLAQFVGIVMVSLDVTAIAGLNPGPEPDTWLIDATFQTPTPGLGAAIARYAVDRLNAQLRSSDENTAADTLWYDDPTLFDLKQQCRREALPIASLQLIAEAQQRGVPVLYRPDGAFQLGYGTHGLVYDPTTVVHEMLLAVRWEDIPSVALYAVTGERQRATVVDHIAAFCESVGCHCEKVQDADYQTTLMRLIETEADHVVIGLETADIIQRGLAFAQCQLGVLTDCDGPYPSVAQSSLEWIQALGLPMLLTTGKVLLNTSEPAFASLIPSIASDIVPLHALDDVLQQMLLHQ